MNKQAWRDEANCQGTDTEVFFNEREDHAYPPQLLRICGACKVKADCLEYALDNEIEFGFWGGLTSIQRRKLTGRIGQHRRLISKQHGTL